MLKINSTIAPTNRTETKVGLQIICAAAKINRIWFNRRSAWNLKTWRTQYNADIRAQIKIIRDAQDEIMISRHEAQIENQAVVLSDALDHAVAF